ncbi:hypothetical protein H0H93_013541 [Arthromyces matolae]|nr:hypothetical protein H0H93_013541 [Arthromyces matolae]
MQGGSPISPPRRHFSLRTARRESDGKASYREQLDNNDFGEFTTSTNSKDTQETFVSPGSIPNSHHLEKMLPPPPPSDKPPFTIHAEKLLALSESDTSEDSPSISASPIEDTLAFFYDYSLKRALRS